jgi:hypothetical protein
VGQKGRNSPDRLGLPKHLPPAAIDTAMPLRSLAAPKRNSAKNSFPS